jgi:hypothetical protein
MPRKAVSARAIAILPYLLSCFTSVPVQAETCTQAANRLGMSPPQICPQPTAQGCSAPGGTLSNLACGQCCNANSECYGSLVCYTASHSCQLPSGSTIPTACDSVNCPNNNQCVKEAFGDSGLYPSPNGGCCTCAGTCGGSAGPSPPPPGEGGGEESCKDASGK